MMLVPGAGDGQDDFQISDVFREVKNICYLLLPFCGLYGSLQPTGNIFL
jgi:hypothetical protein